MTADDVKERDIQTRIWRWKYSNKEIIAFSAMGIATLSLAVGGIWDAFSYGNGMRGASPNFVLLLISTLSLYQVRWMVMINKEIEEARKNGDEMPGESIGLDVISV